jgi:hypothetical protein
MPVIKGQPKGQPLPDEKRAMLLQELKNELAGRSTGGSLAVAHTPLIFEIPLEFSEQIDVLVVWEWFDGVRSEDRSALIIEAYVGQAAKISQALGVTLEEALDQELLPYNVIPNTSPTGVDPKEIEKAMVEEGGFSLADKIRLWFPTRQMAEAAMVRLNQRLPQGAWVVREGNLLA